MLENINLNNETELCSLMRNHGSDKSTGHNYTKVYHHLFHDLKHDFLTVLEVGLGTNNITVPSNMGVNGVPLASVRGWRDYFINSMIYGADIDKGILKDEERIKTFYIDQLNDDSISTFKQQTDVMFDIIVDDGLHSLEANQNLFENLFTHVNDNGYYIIEDLSRETFNAMKKIVVLYEHLFDIEYFDYNLPNNSHDNKLIIMKRKETSINDLICELPLSQLEQYPSDEFLQYFQFEIVKQVHKSPKVFSFSLFNQDVDTTNPNDKNPRVHERYINNIPFLQKTIKRDFPDYKLVFYISNEFKDLDFGEDANVYACKNEVFGGLGMFWKHTVVDLPYVQEAMVCDLDLPDLNIFHIFKCETNSRFVAKGNNNNLFECQSKRLHRVWTSILGSTIKWKADTIKFNMTLMICKFLYYQKYLIHTEKYSPFGRSAKTEGYGNRWFAYGSDEAFLNKVMYYYLVRKGELDTVIDVTNNRYEPIDMDFCRLYKNNIITI